MVSSRFSGVVALVSVTVLALPAAAIYEEPTPLSGPMEAFADVTPTGWELSTDGQWAVFRADLLVDDRTDAWAVRLDGTTPTPIHLNAGATADDVHAVHISPDSAYAVFVGDLHGDGNAVYSRNIDGTGPLVRLSDPPTAGSGAGLIAITPDSQHVVWTGEMDVLNVKEVYSAPIHTAGQQIQLSEDPTPGGEVDTTWPRISPDSQYVIYHGDLDVAGTVEMYSARIGEAESQTLLSSPPVLDGDVYGGLGGFGAVITPDSSHVVYYGDLDVDGQVDVYAAPIDSSGGEVRISEATNPGGSINPQQLHVTDDSSTAVYRGDFETDGVDALFAAALDGSGQRRLSRTDVPGSDVQFHRPVGDQLVYSGELTTPGVTDLYTRPFAGSTSQQRRLTAATGTGSGVQYGYFQVTDDGRHVLFLGVMDNAPEIGMWSVRVADGNQVRLSSPPVPNGDVFIFFVLSEDGRRVVYRGDLLEDERWELFSSPVGVSGQQVRVHGPVTTGGDVDGVHWLSPDSSFVVYAGDIDVDEQFELYASGAGQLPPLAVEGVTASSVGTTTATITWDAPTSSGQVTGFEVTLDPPAATSAPRQAAAAVQLGPDATSADLTQLNPDTDYTATVVAVNDAGDSPAATVDFTTTAEGVQRLSGDNRYATAAAIALDRFDVDTVDTVYLATGANFPDALAGGPLAAADGAPILLTTRDTLPDVTADAIEAFAPSRLILLGGPAAISEQVLFDASVAAGMSDQLVERIFGDNRYETAAAIAAELPASSEVYLATGTNFPDALTGGPATGGAPILLTRQDRLPDETTAVLADREPDVIVALGGEAAIADDVVADAAREAGNATSTRVFGLNRFETAVAIADTLPQPDTVYIAVGSNFPDALAGGPAAFGEGAPILLTSSASLTAATQTWLEALPNLHRIVVLGGEAVISPEVEATLASLLN